MVLTRIDITNRTAAQRVINNPGLRGQPFFRRAGLPGSNFRLFVTAKNISGVELKRELDKAIRTGVFPTEKFISPQIVRVSALRGRVRPSLASEIRSSQKQFAAEKKLIARQIERRGGTIGALRQREETLRKAKEFFQRVGGPLAVSRSSVDTVANTAAAFRTITNRGISEFQKSVLLANAKETGLAKLNADFVSGRISRGQFVALASAASRRAAELERKKISRTRDLLLRGNFVSRLGANIKIAIASFKKIEQPLTSEQVQIRQIDRDNKDLEKLQVAFERDSKVVDERIKRGIANVNEINSLNRLGDVISTRQRKLNKNVDDFNKKQEAELKAIPRARREDFVGELKFQDVIDEFKSIPRDADNAGKFVIQTLGTRKFDRREFITLKDGTKVRKIDIAGTFGQLVGGVLSAFGAVGTLTSFSVQERFKNIVPSGQLVIPPELVSLVRATKKVIPDPVKGVSNFFITNPLKFVKIENGKYIITPRAVGETGRAAFDIIILVSGGVKGGKILKINKAGKPVSVLGKFKLTIGKVRTSFFNKLKIKNFKNIELKGAKLKGLTGKKATDLFPTTIKGLEQEIQAIKKAQVRRIARERRPITVKSLQAELGELRITRKPIDVLKPLPKNIKKLQSEITSLKKIKVFKVRRININSLKNKLVRLREQINPVTALRSELPQTQRGLLRSITQAENELRKIRKGSGAIKRGLLRRNEIVGTIIKLSKENKIKLKPENLRTLKSAKKELLKILELIKQRKLISRRPIRRKALEIELLQLRQRISPNLLKKPVPKNLNSLIREVEGTKKALLRIEKVKKDFSRRPVLLRKFENEIFSLRESLGLNVLDPIPKNISILRKTIENLKLKVKGRQRLRFSRQRSNFRKQVLKRLLLALRERQALIRFKRKPDIFMSERINFLNKEVNALSKKIPSSVGGKKPIQIQVQKEKLKKKKIVTKEIKGRVEFRRINTERLPIVDTVFLRTPGVALVGLSEIQRGLIRENNLNVIGKAASGVLTLNRQRFGLLITPGGRVIRINKIKVSTKSRLNLKEKLRLENKLANSLRPVQAITSKVRVAQKVATRLRERARIRERVRIRELTKQKLKQKIKRKKVVRKGKPIILLPKKQIVSFETVSKSRSGFNVLVRKRGRLVRINRFPLSGADALAMGGSFADNNAVRSFAVTKTKGRIRRITVGRFKKFKFRRPVAGSKLQRFLVTEKTAFAIDSRGEKEQISRKGQIALRARKKKVKIKKTKLKKRTKKTVKKRKKVFNVFGKNVKVTIF